MNANYLGYAVGDVVYVFHGSHWSQQATKGKCTKVSPSGQVTVSQGSRVWRFTPRGNHVGSGSYSDTRIWCKKEQDERYADVVKECRARALRGLWASGLEALRKEAPSAELLRVLANKIEAELAKDQA